MVILVGSVMPPCAAVAALSWKFVIVVTQISFFFFFFVLSVFNGLKVTPFFKSKTVPLGYCSAQGTAFYVAEL